MRTNLRSVGVILSVDILADEPPERLDVVDGGPERVHLARLGERVKGVHCVVFDVIQAASLG